MSWPFSPKTTYVANSVPAIKAADLNDVQAGINVLNLAVNREHFLIADDFHGETLPDELWKFQSADIAISDDSANGAFGAVELDTTNNTYFRSYAALPIGTSDFRFYARLRWPTKTTALAVV